LNDPLRDLLWHTTPGLGAALIARLGAPEPDGAELGIHPRVRTPVPPAPAGHRLAHGVTHGVIGWYGAGGAQRPNTPADPDRLLRLLERDDPLVNATLFRLGRRPALRHAIVSRRRFHPGAPTYDTDDDGLLDLAPDLSRKLLTTTNAAHLDAALWAHDPELAAWASIAHAPRHRVGALKARITLLAAGHAHHVRVTRPMTDALLPELGHAERQEAKGAAPLRLLPADRYAFANQPAGQRCSLWANPVALLRAGSLTVERFVADARATDVPAAASHHPRLARVVARALTRHLGDTLDAWLVAAHLARARRHDTRRTRRHRPRGGAPLSPAPRPRCRSALGSSKYIEGRREAPEGRWRAWRTARRRPRRRSSA